MAEVNPKLTREDAKLRNEQIVSALRKQFEPLAEKLTPEVEPATVFVLPPTPGISEDQPE